MIQAPLFRPPANWTPTPVRQMPSWEGASRVAIDTETYDPKLNDLGPGVRRGGRVVGISFAIEGGPSHYLPIGHSANNVDEAHVWSYIREQAASFKGTLVGANLPYDLDYMAEKGVWFSKVQWFRDVQIAEPLIDELQHSYSLDAILTRHGLPNKDETLLKDALIAWGCVKKDGSPDKGKIYALPSEYVAPYAIADVELPLKLLRRQERIIEEQDLWQIFDLESKVMPVLLKMRRRGVAIDFARLGKLEDWAISEAKKALDEAYRLTSIRISWTDVWKAAALAPALQEVGIPLEKTKTGQPSIDADLLDRVDHPVADALARARKMNKIVTTFAASVREHETHGRIHCTFNQLRTTKDEEKGEDKGARYGRLSSSDPNMQQQPGRDPEIAPLWRAIYIPDEGKQWAALDYSQQEPRWLVHFAEKTRGGLPRAVEAAEKYRTDPNTDNHTMMAQMCGIERKPAKELFLGKIYGMGGAKLCKKLGLPTEWITKTNQHGTRMIEIAGPEGKKIINKFDRELPFVNMLAEICKDTALRRGYITTILGRRCRFPELHGNPFKKYDWCHKALNRLIQGSSADQTKAAMVQLDAAGFEPQLQIHDEIDASVENRAEAEAMADIMRNCVVANVPFKVDVEIGPSWGEAA